MYKVEPLVNPNHPVELSDRMYMTKKLTIGTTAEEQDMNALEQLEAQQEKVMERLRKLQLKVAELAKARGLNLCCEPPPAVQVNGKISLAIHADVEQPPLTVFLFMQLLRAKGHKVFVTSHLHSSVTCALNKRTSKLCSLLENGDLQRGDCDILVSIIWKQDLAEKCVIVANGSFSSHPLLGESMLIRYLLAIQDEDSLRSPAVNSFLDLVDFSVIHGAQKEKSKSLQVLDQVISKSTATPGGWLCEMYLWSALHSNESLANLPASLKKVVDACNKQEAYKAVKQCL